MSTANTSGNASNTASKKTPNAPTPPRKAIKPAPKAVMKPGSPARKIATPRPAAAPTGASTATNPVASRPGAAPVAESRPSKVGRKKVKADKPKVVRDSFTIPKAEYAQLAELKKRGVKLGLEVKKSELLRAGLLLLVSTTDAAFRKAMAQVPTLKTGRPGKD